MQSHNPVSQPMTSSRTSRSREKRNHETNPPTLPSIRSTRLTCGSFLVDVLSSSSPFTTAQTRPVLSIGRALHPQLNPHFLASSISVFRSLILLSICTCSVCSKSKPARLCGSHTPSSNHRIHAPCHNQVYLKSPVAPDPHMPLPFSGMSPRCTSLRPSSPSISQRPSPITLPKTGPLVLVPSPAIT